MTIIRAVIKKPNTLILSFELFGKSHLCEKVIVLGKALLNHKNRPTRLKCYYFAEWYY